MQTCIKNCSKLPLEKEMATHSSVLAWRISGTGELHGLPSMGSHRVGHDWSDLAAAASCLRNMLLQYLHGKVMSETSSILAHLKFSKFCYCFCNIYNCIFTCPALAASIRGLGKTTKRKNGNTENFMNLVSLDANWNRCGSGRLWVGMKLTDWSVSPSLRPHQGFSPSGLEGNNCMWVMYK